MTEIFFSFKPFLINSFTVPDNKLFVILNARYSGISSNLYVNVEPVPGDLDNNNTGVMTMKGSDVLSTYETNSNSGQHFVELNGYLVDEGYFSLSSNMSSSEYTNSNSLTLNEDTLSFGGQYIVIPGINSAYVGQYRDGGVVFYVDQTGQHGLVCDIVDLPQSIWAGTSCNQTLLITDSVSAPGYLGGGYQNTIDMVNNPCYSDWEDSPYAAEQCFNLIKNGYDDWYLPNIAELVKIYEYMDVINQKCVEMGGNAFTTSPDPGYWSSSEYSTSSAWLMQVTTGGYSATSKSSYLNIRAIREF